MGIDWDGRYDIDEKRKCKEEKTVQAKSETQTRRLESQKSDPKTDSEEEETVQAKSETQTRRLESQKPDPKTDSLTCKEKMEKYPQSCKYQPEDVKYCWDEIHAEMGEVRMPDCQYAEKREFETRSRNTPEVFEYIRSEQAKVRKKKDRGETLTCEDKLAYAIDWDGRYDIDEKRKCKEEKTVQAKSETQTRRLESQKPDPKTDSLTCKEKMEKYPQSCKYQPEDVKYCWDEIHAEMGEVRMPDCQYAEKREFETRSRNTPEVFEYIRSEQAKVRKKKDR